MKKMILLLALIVLAVVVVAYLRTPSRDGAVRLSGFGIELPPGPPDKSTFFMCYDPIANTWDRCK